MSRNNTLLFTAVTKWMNGWKRNGFKTAKGTDVKNRDDIVKLYNLCQKIDVKWVSNLWSHTTSKNVDSRESAAPCNVIWYLASFQNFLHNFTLSDTCAWTSRSRGKWKSWWIGKERSRTLKSKLVQWLLQYMPMDGVVWKVCTSTTTFNELIIVQKELTLIKSIHNWETVCTLQH